MRADWGKRNNNKMIIIIKRKEKNLNLIREDS